MMADSRKGRDDRQRSHVQRKADQEIGARHQRGDHERPTLYPAP